MHGCFFPRFALAATALVLVLCGCQKQPLAPPVGTTAATPAAPMAVSRLEAGKRAVAAGDCAKAIAELAEAVRLDDGSVEARLYLGLCAARTGDLARAETVLGEAAARAPNDPRPLEALGIALYAAGRRDAAGDRLTEAARRGSKSAQVQYYLGNLAMIAGDCREGLAAYRKAMILDPSYAPAVTEYKNARVACARAETPPTEPPAPKPQPKPAPKPQPQGAPAPAAAAPAQGPGDAAQP